MPEHGRDGQTIQTRYPAEIKRQLLRFLERRHLRFLRDGRPRKINAWALACVLRLRPDQARESRRRRVRELVDEARGEHAPIASDGEGYWLATEWEDYEATERYLRGMGLAQLATAAGIRRMPAKRAARRPARADPPADPRRDPRRLGRVRPVGRTPGAAGRRTRQPSRRRCRWLPDPRAPSGLPVLTAQPGLAASRSTRFHPATLTSPPTRRLIRVTVQSFFSPRAAPTPRRAPNLRSARPPLTGP